MKQYYTQMHKDPSQMHRFYLDQSSFVHGGAEMGSEEPVIGQKVCVCVCVCVVALRVVKGERVAFFPCSLSFSHFFLHSKLVKSEKKRGAA